MRNIFRKTNTALCYNVSHVIIILMITLLFTACNKNNKQEPAVITHTETDIASDIIIEEISRNTGSYPKILNGDLSGFEGTWVNNRSNRRQLRYDGTSGGGENPFGFSFNESGYYEWSVSFEEFGGYAVYLLPAGIDIQGDHEVNGNWSHGILPTDKTKVRIVLIFGDAPTLSEVYYREGEIQYILQTIEYNDQSIPINIFYSKKEYDSFSLDRAVLTYEGVTQTVNLGGIAVYFDGAEFAFRVSANDFNFDNFMDIHIIDIFGMNSNNEIFLYNPQSKSYYHNKELSLRGSISLDKEKQAIIQTEIVDADPDTIISEYQWENRQLALIHSTRPDGNILNKHIQKTITIIGIPANLNDMCGEISLAVNAAGAYNWIAWSEPVLVKNGSVTIKLLVNNDSHKSNDPFNKDGGFIVYLIINEADNYDLPNWQGMINGYYIYDENTTIFWNEFSEVFG